MANELPKLQAWIYDALTTDVAAAAIIDTRVFQDQAPEGAVYPFVVFNLQDARDTNGMGQCRVLTRALMQIKVIARDEHSDNSRTVADRIDALFGAATRAQHSTDSSFQFTGRRESPLSYTEPERDSSRWFRHLGGLYWITVSAV